MKPQRIKQRVAKTVHIVSAFVLGLLAHTATHWMGWDSPWVSWSINIVAGLYCAAILFSRTPVPLSRAANEDMQAYEAWCRTMGKQPSREEYLTDAWKDTPEYLAYCDQHDKAESIIEKYVADRSAVRNDPTLDMAAKKAKLDRLGREFDTNISDILTREQKERLAAAGGSERLRRGLN